MPTLISPPFEPTHIFDHLWLGTIWTAKQLVVINPGIGMVLNCTDETIFRDRNVHFAQLGLLDRVAIPELKLAYAIRVLHEYFQQRTGRAAFLPLNGPQVVTAATPGVSVSFAVVDTNESETVPTVGTVTGVSARGGQYSVIAYTQYDVGSVTNPQTAIPVQAAGEYVVLAAPADGAVGDRITLPNGTVITVAGPDLTFAAACTLIPGGTARALGFAVTNFFTYLGGIQILSSVGGISYLMLTQRPDLMQVTNYMHSMGSAIKTHFVLRVPWIGATPNTLATLATANAVIGYTQTDFSRSFVHFTGAKGNTPGTFFLGCSIVPSNAGNGTDAGNYAPFNPAVNHADDIVGKVLGVELMYPIRDYADRVRTQFDRATEFVGPRMDPNPVTFQMGGSATKGLDFAISLGTNGLFQLAVRQNITALTSRPELSTYVIMHVNCR
jgi:hypothetical protein